MTENQLSTKSWIKTGVFFVLLAGLMFLAWVKFTTPKVEFEFEEGWYETFTLKNGMQVYVIPNHKIPAVAHMVWYKVGAMDEAEVGSGIAHFLEHLMFKGTKKYPDGQFSKLVALNGGRENAFTSYDFTAYFQTIAKDKLPLVMKLEADRMKNLILDDDAVEKELKVIIEERKMRIDNSPSALLAEQMDASLFQSHPYGSPVIGWKEKMEELTKAEAVEFYNKYYDPANAILVVAGDVTADEIEPLAKKYYGVLKSKGAVEKHEPAVPEQRAARRVLLEDERVKDPELWRYYVAPSLNYGNTEQHYSLEVAAKILGGGNLSRLYQSLVVEKKIATSAGAGYSGISRGPGQISVFAIPAKGVPLATLEKAINQEIKKFIEEGVTDEELANAKKSLVVSQVYAQEGLQSMAFNLGELVAVGAEPDYIVTYPDRINAVTADQVADAVSQVLQTKNSVTGVLKNGE